ncbi:MAG: hypothetical protein H6578_09635 [Chitinophagales bacterium]|nr:hypothetical protein [Chitinophagales bacterium]
MKKLFLSLFVMGSITFGLQSCKDSCDDVTCPTGQVCEDGDCVTDPNYDPCTGVTCATGEICEDGTCVTDPNAYDCTECGTYNTEATGNMNIANGAVLDTTWTDTNKVVIVAQFLQSGSDYSLSVDLSGISSLLTDPIAVEGSYNTSTKLFTVTDFEYSVQGIATVLVNGTADFSTTDAVSGSLAITAPAGASVPVDGQLDFAGTKQ